MITPMKKEAQGLVKCDTCNFVFTIAHRTRSIDLGTLRYFKCPQCDKEYPYAIDNATTEHVRVKLEKDRKAFRRGYLAFKDLQKSSLECKAVCEGQMMEYFKSQKKL